MKWLFGNTCSIFNLQQCDSGATKNNIFLPFKFDLRFLRILKLLIIYLFFVFEFYLSSFSALISFLSNDLFLYRFIEVWKDTIGQKQMQALLFSQYRYWRKFCILEGWLTDSVNYTSKSSSDGRSPLCKMGKVGLVFYTVSYSFYCKRVSVNFFYFPQ